MWSSVEQGPRPGEGSALPDRVVRTRPLRTGGRPRGRGRGEAMEAGPGPAAADWRSSLFSFCGPALRGTREATVCGSHMGQATESALEEEAQRLEEQRRHHLYDAQRRPPPEQPMAQEIRRLHAESDALMEERFRRWTASGDTPLPAHGEEWPAEPIRTIRVLPRKRAEQPLYAEQPLFAEQPLPGRFSHPEPAPFPVAPQRRQEKTAPVHEHIQSQAQARRQPAGARKSKSSASGCCCCCFRTPDNAPHPPPPQLRQPSPPQPPGRAVAPCRCQAVMPVICSTLCAPHRVP